MLIRLLILLLVLLRLLLLTLLLTLLLLVLRDDLLCCAFCVPAPSLVPELPALLLTVKPAYMPFW
ncbi:MAG: hypothetical protein R2838_05850 [Caldilineaceae bacterium]